MVRLAVIVPEHRLWHWHKYLIEQLRQKHDVVVFVDGNAAPYPRILQAWFKAELAFFDPGNLPKPEKIEPDYHPISALPKKEDDLVVNLAEHRIDCANSIEIRYDGALDSMALIDRLLARRTPHLMVCQAETFRLLAESHPAIEDKTLLTRGLRYAFARCISRIERALNPSGGQVERIREIPAAAFHSNRLLAFAVRVCAIKATRFLLRQFRHPQHWSVAMRVGTAPFFPMADDGQRFYGDPFLYEKDGRTYLFVEECSYATGKGVISAAEVIDGRISAKPVCVLERPYHLSYPCVFAFDGNVYMMPETSANRTVELYRASEFPWRWELDRTLIQGVILADTTPIFHGGHWWLFAAAVEHGGASQDELFLFYNDNLAGPWRSHPRNPVKSDCRSSRPAGRILSQGGRLFRPVQDCEDSYGAGLAWFENNDLTPTSFSEKEIIRWAGKRDLGVRGLHTFDHIGQLQVIDIKYAVGRGLLRRRARPLTPRASAAIDLEFSPALLMSAARCP